MLIETSSNFPLCGWSMFSSGHPSLDAVKIIYSTCNKRLLVCISTIPGDFLYCTVPMHFLVQNTVGYLKKVRDEFLELAKT